MPGRHRFPLVVLLVVAVTLVAAGNAQAYIGPGAGMEFITYAMGLIAMVGVAFISILMWPIYTLLRWIRGSKTPAATAPEIPAPAPSILDAPLAASPSGPSTNSPVAP